MSILIADDVVVVKRFVEDQYLPLNRYEVNVSRWTGTQRNRLDYERHAKPRGLTLADWVLANHRAGAGSEFAFAKALGVYPKLEFDTWLSHDLVLPSGTQLGVTNDAAGRLIVDLDRIAKHAEKHMPPPAFYVVLRGELPAEGHSGSFQFVGWATHEEVLKAPIQELLKKVRDDSKESKPRLAHVLKTLRSPLEILAGPLKGPGYR